jgi:hypothetical protein
MWDLLGSLFDVLGSLFAGGNPFHGSVEKPAFFWLAHLAGVLLLTVVIATTWYAYLRAM